MSAISTSYVNETAKGIMSILTSNKTIWWSWGARQATAMTYKDEYEMPALAFRVSGFKHKGIVVVALDDAADLFNIYLYDSRFNKMKKSLKGIYCDELRDCVDSLVETGDAKSPEYAAKVSKFFAKTLTA